MPLIAPVLFIFFSNAPPSTEIYTLSLHDALPIFPLRLPSSSPLSPSSPPVTLLSSSSPAPLSSPPSPDGQPCLLPPEQVEQLNVRSTGMLNSVQRLFTHHLVQTFGCDYSTR